MSDFDWTKLNSFQGTLTPALSPDGEGVSIRRLKFRLRFRGFWRVRRLPRDVRLEDFIKVQVDDLVFNSFASKNADCPLGPCDDYCHAVATVALVENLQIAARGGQRVAGQNDLLDVAAKHFRFGLPNDPAAIQMATSSATGSTS